MDKSQFDPEVYDFYKESLEGAGFDAAFSASDLAALRAGELARHAENTAPYEVAEKFDERISREGAESLSVRVYIPDSVKQAAAQAPAASAAGESGPDAPVILYFHGGGFVMGAVRGHDALCGRLADACRAAVVSVEYRLAPEFPFPACIDDAVCAANWAEENAARFGANPARLMAAGDSSGAAISAALAILAKEGKAPRLSGLILFYGVYGCLSLEESASAQRYGDGQYVLPVRAMEKMMDFYIPAGTDPMDSRLYPGGAPDLSGMPPAFVITAGLDPLRDDGEAFARRLLDSGCEVECVRMDGMMHGFMLYWQHFHRAEQLLQWIGDKVTEKNRRDGVPQAAGNEK